MLFDNPPKRLKSIKPKRIIRIEEQYIFSTGDRKTVSPC